MPRRPQVAGMETPKRARRRKPDTAKVDLEPPRRNCGGQGAHREGVWLFFVGGPERFMGLLRAAWQELLNPSKAG